MESWVCSRVLVCSMCSMASHLWGGVQHLPREGSGLHHSGHLEPVELDGLGCLLRALPPLLDCPSHGVTHQLWGHRAQVGGGGTCAFR